MADWGKINSRGKVLDRRNVVGFGGMGLTGIILVMGVTYLLGGNPLDVLLQNPQVLQQAINTEDTSQYEGEDSYEVFVSQVVGSANDTWTSYFANNNDTYTEPTLVLFRGYTESRCGGAQSVVGPHYCQLDNTIYLDETFFAELKDRFGAAGGDVAEAYVIAHEVGHHVQNQLGRFAVDDITQAYAVGIELEADCFAGLWAYSLSDQGIFEPNEIKEAMDAAAAVGDDNIQQRTQGEIQPETWTHGSSAQRIEAFTTGYEQGSVSACAAYTQNI